VIRPRDVLEHYRVRHNRGVASGDFAPLLEMFGEGARLEFRGAPLGPFAGKPAILRAFAEHPPSDELVLFSSSEPEPDVIEADYAWKSRPRERAGRLRIEIASASIARLVISVERA
jgi:hypothetical protein